MEKRIFILIILLIIIIPTFKVFAQDTTQNVNKSIEVLNTRINDIEQLLKDNKIDSSYLNIVEKSNQALSFPWMVVNTIFVAFTALFTLLLTILAFFAASVWGSVKKSKQTIKDILKQKNELISRANQEFDEIKKLRIELEEDKKKIKTPKQIKNYAQRIEDLTKRLDDKIRTTEQRVNDLNIYGASIGSSVSNPVFGGTISAG